MAMDEAKWFDWSDTVNKRLAKLEKRSLKTTEEVLLDAIAKAIPRIVHTIIEGRKCMRDAGVWSDVREYAPGATVTDRGALWCAQITNKATRPGDDNAIWRLVNKSDVSAVKRLVKAEIRAQRP